MGNASSQVAPPETQPTSPPAPEPSAETSSQSSDQAPEQSASRSSPQSLARTDFSARESMAKRSAPSKDPPAKRRKTTIDPNRAEEVHEPTRRTTDSARKRRSAASTKGATASLQPQTRRTHAKSAEYVVESSDEGESRDAQTQDQGDDELEQLDATVAPQSSTGVDSIEQHSMERIPRHVLKATRDRTKALARAVNHAPAQQELSHPPISGVQGANNSVRNWLSSQDAGEKSGDREATAKSRKRKRTSTHQKDDDEQYSPQDDESELNPAHENSPAIVPSKKSRSRKTSHGHEPNVQATKKSKSAKTSTARKDNEPIVYKRGAFTREEKELADEVYVAERTRLKFNDHQLNEHIKDWTNAIEFRAAMMNALQGRDLLSVRRFCQRQYHNHKRGPWSATEDQALREAYETHGSKWKIISEIMDRTHEDCRDHWRDYTKHSKTRETGPWSADEEERLTEIVGEALEELRKARPHDMAESGDLSHLESMINWARVVEELGATRNTRQCRDKYAALKQRSERMTRDAEASADSPRTARVTLDDLCTARETKSLLLVREFEIGDFYDIFVEIHSSFPDHTKVYHDEDNVVYSTVSLKNPDSRFGVTYLAGTLRRMALETAIHRWDIPSKTIRRKLTAAPTVPAKAFIFAKWIEENHRTESLARSFRTQLIGEPRCRHDEIMKKVNAAVKKEQQRREEEDAEDYQADEDDPEYVAAREALREAAAAAAAANGLDAAPAQSSIQALQMSQQIAEHPVPVSPLSVAPLPMTTGDDDRAAASASPADHGKPNKSKDSLADAIKTRQGSKKMAMAVKQEPPMVVDRDPTTSSSDEDEEESSVDSDEDDDDDDDDDEDIDEKKKDQELDPTLGADDIDGTVGGDDVSTSSSESSSDSSTDTDESQEDQSEEASLNRVKKEPAVEKATNDDDSSDNESDEDSEDSSEQPTPQQEDLPPVKTEPDSEDESSPDQEDSSDSTSESSSESSSSEASEAPLPMDTAQRVLTKNENSPGDTANLHPTDFVRRLKAGNKKQRPAPDRKQEHMRLGPQVNGQRFMYAI